MHHSYDIFRSQLKKDSYAIDSFNRHYRAWQKSTNNAYKEMDDANLIESISKYLKAHTTKPSFLLLSDCLSSIGLPSTAEEIFKFKRDGVVVIDTVQGYYLLPSQFEQIKNNINNYSSLSDFFEKQTGLFATGYSDGNTYKRFVHDYRKKINNDVISLSILNNRSPWYYPKVNEAIVQDFLFDWLQVNQEKSNIKPITGSFDIKTFAEGSTIKALFAWLCEQPDSYQNTDDYYKKKRELCQKYTESSWRSTKDLFSVTGLKGKTLLDRIETGYIHAEKIGDNYFVAASELRRLVNIKSQYITIYDFCLQLLDEMDIPNVFLMGPSKPSPIYDYIIENNWWGITPVGEKEIHCFNIHKCKYVILKSDIPKIKEPIMAWFTAHYDPANYIDETDEI